MNKTKEIHTYLINNPGSTANQISDALHLTDKQVRNTLSYLMSRGEVVSKGCFGHYQYSLVTSFAATSINNNATKPESPSVPDLKSFSPRELLEELKSRGYVWEKMYVKQFVDYSKI